MKNSNKICFISCVNNKAYETELRRYINHLIIPEGMGLEIQTIWGAPSMAAGYNRAMQETDAKYKVYLHQDVFLLNQNFIRDVLRIFEEAQVGMIGMVGTPKLAENYIMWHGSRAGKVYFNSRYLGGKTDFSDGRQTENQEMEAIDGLCMVTQYDLPWKEDLFDGWDFYDISQSLEFKKAGYKIIVPYQEEPWALHDNGFENLKNYYKYRRICKETYDGIR